MKLLLFTPKMCSGGAQRVAVLLSSGMMALGHDVCIAAPTLEGELVPQINLGCRLVDLKSRKPIRARRQLAELVNTIKPDAVICFGIYTGIAAALSRAAWKSRPALVIRNENNLALDWREGTPLNRLAGPVLSRWAAARSHVVSVTHSLEGPTAEYLRIPRSRVSTILNPVIDDTEHLPTAAAASLHPWLQDSNGPVFVAMGRLEHQKGFDVLIRAFSQVHDGSSARLVIFGQGSLQTALQTQIDAAGLGTSVTLAGHTEHPVVQMSAAHAFVLSSRFEGFGLVLVEALQAGTRVISTNCNYGPEEILEGGRFGTLVPVADAQALANAMLASLDGPAKEHLPEAAWFQQFTATTAARQHIQLIESLIQHG